MGSGDDGSGGGGGGKVSGGRPRTCGSGPRTRGRGPMKRGSKPCKVRVSHGGSETDGSEGETVLETEKKADKIADKEPKKRKADVRRVLLSSTCRVPSSIQRHALVICFLFPADLTLNRGHR